MKLINWEIVKNPMNWLIIGMMLVVAGVAGHLVMRRLGVEPVRDNNEA